MIMSWRYVCPYCNEKFKYKSSWTNHIKKKHRREIEIKLKQIGRIKKIEYE